MSCGGFGKLAFLIHAKPPSSCLLIQQSLKREELHRSDPVAAESELSSSTGCTTHDMNGGTEVNLIEGSLQRWQHKEAPELPSSHGLTE